MFNAETKYARILNYKLQQKFIMLRGINGNYETFAMENNSVMEHNDATMNFLMDLYIERLQGHFNDVETICYESPAEVSIEPGRVVFSINLIDVDN